MPRLLWMWMLAAGVLGSMRALAAWGAEQPPDQVPGLLRALLPGAPPAQNSELRFELLFHNFGELLEGEVVEVDFPFYNDGDQPISLGRARHCGCVQLDYPRDVPIGPGESGVVKARLDSHGRSGVQVKPIQLFTDEEGEGPHTGVLLKGSVTSPVVLRRRNVVWANANPGEVRTWSIPYEVDEDAEPPRLEQPEEDSFYSAQLSDPGVRRGSLDIEVRAPGSPGSRESQLILRSKIRSGRWEGTDWQASIPIRVTVRAPFRAIPGTVRLQADGSGNLTLNLARHSKVWVQRIEVAGAPLSIERVGGDSPASIQRYRITRNGEGEIPEGTTLDVWSNLDSSTPALRVPLLLAAGGSGGRP